MQTAIFFIEYLITGAIALMWVLFLFEVPIDPSSGRAALDASDALYLVPAAYILGMVVDVASDNLLRGWKVVRTLFKPRSRYDDDVSETAKRFNIPSASVYIREHSDRLARELGLRISRTRVARGAFLNASMFFLVALQKLIWLRPNRLSVSYTFALIVLPVVFLGVYTRFYYLERRFSTLAVETLMKTGPNASTTDKAYRRPPAAENT